MDFGLPIESPKQQKEETIYTMPNGEPIQRGKPGRPSYPEDVEAINRLRNGEDRVLVRREWEINVINNEDRHIFDYESAWRRIKKKAR